MANKTAILAIKIIADAAGASRGLDETASKFDKFESMAGRAAIGVTAVVGALAAVGKAAFDEASALQQSAGAVESVFAAQAEAVDKLAAGAAQTVGLATSEYSQFAAVVGSQFKNLGVPMDEVVGTTDALIAKAADLSAMFGGTTSEAVEALSSLFRGETDPIERYGVSIKQSDVNARLAAQGLSKLEGEAKRNAETQARLALLNEQTAAATGQFARESETAAGAQQRMSAEVKNAKAALGEALLPVVAGVATELGKMATWAKENTDTLQKMALVVLGVAAAVYAVNAALKLYHALMALVNGVKWLIVKAQAMGAAIASGVSWAVFYVQYAAMMVGIGVQSAAAWLTAKAQAAGAAIASAAAWLTFRVQYAAMMVGIGVQSAAAWAVAKAQAIGSAIASGAAWLTFRVQYAATMAAIGVSAAATWLAAKAQSIGSALASAAAWVASSASTVGALALQGAAFLAQKVAMAAGAVATGVMTAAQWALNAALNANPFGLIVIAIVAVIAVIVLLWNNCETFRNVVTAVASAAAAVWQWVVDAVSGVINWVGQLLDKVGGVGGIFEGAMNIAKGAVDLLLAPIRAVIDLVSSLIGWIGRIKFPSPPSWISDLFGAGGADGLNMVPAALDYTRFYPAAPATFAAPQPELTAAASPLAGLASLAGGGGTTNVTNVNITVDGSGIVDPRRVAAEIRDVLALDASTRGLTPASMGRSTRSGIR
ncbi:hypothetical protein [Tomitella biformata]|uniref:hypothetical protein n=1 Tax=Tomitella biformata TaxID=630403 RepID=UPI0004B91A67|nr:hypothetical protein [Tomitella biformata]